MLTQNSDTTAKWRRPCAVSRGRFRTQPRTSSMTCLVKQSGDTNRLFICPVCSASSHPIHFHFSHLCNATQESAIDFLPSCGRAPRPHPQWKTRRSARPPVLPSRVLSRLLLAAGKNGTCLLEPRLHPATREQQCARSEFP